IVAWLLPSSGAIVNSFSSQLAGVQLPPPGAEAVLSKVKSFVGGPPRSETPPSGPTYPGSGLSASAIVSNELSFCLPAITLRGSIVFRSNELPGMNGFRSLKKSVFATLYARCWGGASPPVLPSSEARPEVKWILTTYAAVGPPTRTRHGTGLPFAWNGCGLFTVATTPDCAYRNDWL